MSTKKRQKLGSALRSVDKAESSTTGAAPEATQEQGHRRTTAPSREGRKMIAGYFDPAVSKQLRALAVEEDTTTQALLGEALNLLFQNYKKPPVA